MRVYSEKIVNIDAQLLFDKSTGIIVYISTLGGHQTLPEVSEELDWRYYRDRAPYGVFQSPLKYIINSNQYIELRGPISKEDEDRTYLLHLKAWALSRLLLRIAYKRSQYTKELPFQDEIYRLKIDEAKRFRYYHEINPPKDNQTDKFDPFPFLTSYAEIEGIDLKKASEIILFKEEEYLECLRITEHNRLLWSKKIRAAKDVDEITDIVKQLQNQRFIYSTYYPFS